MKIKEDGGARILFDPKTGFKARFSSEPYEKSSTPELVDVKITNYCPYGCVFCYQASTKEGQHADWNTLLEVTRWLSQAGVFEVAIGGGEPSMHPDFGQYLFLCRSYGIVPNFTTFGVEWLKNPELVSIVNETVGGIGVSVHTSRDLSKVRKVKEAVPNCQVMAQHVFGTRNYEDTRKIIIGSEHVLLLGYKTVGFGKNVQPQRYESYVVRDLLSSARALSVDTAFLELYGEVLDEMGIPHYLRSSPEGKFSCYIDAVEGRMGPSSYTEELTPVEDYYDFLKQYRRY